MSERAKKILFAVGFGLVSIGMGYAIYYMLFRPPSAAPTPAAPPELAGGLTGAGPSGPTSTVVTPQPGVLPPGGNVAVPPTPPAPEKTQLLRDSVTQSVTPGSDGNGARFYNPDDGRFYRVSSDGTVTALGDRQFFNAQSVEWANTSDQVIVNFPDGSNVYYDFAAQRQVTLPSHWQGFGFSPDDSQLAAKSVGVDPENRFLFVSNPDGTEAKAIAALGDNADKAHVAWSPSGQIVGYSTTGDPQGNNQQQILFIGENRENFKGLIVPGQGFVPNWSPTGKEILFSAYSPDSNNKPLLWIASGDPNTMGANRRTLNLNTWADKCAWAGDTELFCAVPQSLPDNSGVMRSEFTTLADDVYHIDLSVGSAVKVSTGDQTHPVRQPIVSKDGSQFIFTDAVTGRLYRYDLK